MNLKKKYYFWSTILLCIVIFIWCIFYFCLTALIQRSTQEQLDYAANQIIKDLGDEFQKMEQITFTFSQNEAVKAFAQETEIRAYFDMAGQISTMLQNSFGNESLIGSVIVFNHEGAFYRFRGSTGNTACRRISFMIKELDAPEHLVLETANARLIGYANGIYDLEGKRIGAVAVLLDEDAILSKLMKYNQPDTLHISIAAKKEILVSDRKELSGTSTDEIFTDAYYYTERHIGITPFSIIVTADIGYINNAKTYYSVAAFFTGLVLVITLLLFGAAAQKHFFRPMLMVLSSVDSLDLSMNSGKLSYVNSPEFDRLVEKLNEMLGKIDTKNKSVQDALLVIKNTEIRKQKAIVLSLKKQINAHFTVNILNIIRILVSKQDLVRAAELCDGLSMLVRYAHDEDEFINIWDEFDILQNYINIMNIRYDQKFQVNFDLDDRLMDYKMPRMLLQPIIENSVSHGYRNVRQDCRIEITAGIAEREIIIRIKDFGAGIPLERLRELEKNFEESSLEPEAAGGIENIALLNINRRIKYYYGESFGLSLAPVSPNGLEATITIGKDSAYPSDKE